MKKTEIKTSNYKVVRRLEDSAYDVMVYSIGKWVAESYIILPERLNGHIYEAVKIEVMRHNINHPDKEVVLEPNNGSTIRVADKSSGIEVLKVVFDTTYSTQMGFENL